MSAKKISIPMNICSYCYKQYSNVFEIVKEVDGKIYKVLTCQNCKKIIYKSELKDKDKK